MTAPTLRIAFEAGVAEAVQVALCHRIVDIGEEIGNMHASSGMTMGARAAIRFTLERASAYEALIDQLDGGYDQERVLVADEDALFDLANLLHRFGVDEADDWDDEDTPEARKAIACGGRCVAAARVIAASLGAPELVTAGASA